MPEDKKNIPIPQFDKERHGFETMDEFEMKATYKIIVLGNSSTTPSVSKPIPPDMGDEALVGALYENKKDSPYSC